MDKALALESSGPGSNPCEGDILFTEEAWKKWARFVIYKKVNKEKGGNHYQPDFSMHALLNYFQCTIDNSDGSNTILMNLNIIFEHQTNSNVFIYRIWTQTPYF